MAARVRKRAVLSCITIDQIRGSTLRQSGDQEGILRRRGAIKTAVLREPATELDHRVSRNLMS